MRVGAEVAQENIDDGMERAKATSTESGADSNQSGCGAAETSSVVERLQAVRSSDRQRKARQRVQFGVVVGSLTQALLQGFVRRPKRLWLDSKRGRFSVMTSSRVYAS